MDIKVSQICLMPSLLTPHNYSVLADAQPKSQGTEDKLAGRDRADQLHVSRLAPALCFALLSLLPCSCRALPRVMDAERENIL